MEYIERIEDKSIISQEWIEMERSGREQNRRKYKLTQFGYRTERGKQ